MPISLPVDDEANELLSRNALALLIAMLLDQQVPLERAFSAPRDLVRRLGHEPTADELADFDPEALAAVFSERPALHRYPKAMAARTQELARLIVADYGGDAASLWTTAPSGAGAAQAGVRAAWVRRGQGEDLRGAARQAARRAAAGWREAAGPFGDEGSYLSVADITDDESLGRVRSYKQALKAAAKAQGGRVARGAAAGRHAR